MSKLFPDATEAYFLNPKNRPAKKKSSIFEKLNVYFTIKSYAEITNRAPFKDLSLEMQTELRNKGYKILSRSEFEESPPFITRDGIYNYVVSWK